MTAVTHRKREALALLDSLPDSSMALVAWWRDGGGDLARPCTREEVRDGLLAGRINLDWFVENTWFFRWCEDQAAEREASERRKMMRLA